MNCNDVYPLMYRFLEDRLLDDDAGAVRKHLDACSACCERCERIVVLDESVLEAEDDRPSPRLRSLLLSDYRRYMVADVASRSPWWDRMRTVRRVAVIALVAFVSSGGTWYALRDADVRSVHLPETSQVGISLDHLFPLLIRDSYSIVQEDGRTQHGSRIQCVQ